MSVSEIFILNAFKKVADLIRCRLFRSATFYYYDDKHKTHFYQYTQYGAFITRITVVMGQTIKSTTAMSFRITIPGTDTLLTKLVKP